MPNIRILAKAVLQIFCSQGCSYTVNQLIYTLVHNYMPNIRILAKAVLQILFCSQGCSYTKCLCPKKDIVTPLKLFGIGLKFNQLIYFFVCYYMPNIRILATAVLQISVLKVVPIQNACVRKRGITQPKNYGIGSKVNQFIYILVCNYMPNIMILVLAVL